MTRRRKLITEGIEAIEMTAKTAEGGISRCGHCAKSDGMIQTHGIVQYGFVEDKCLEVYQCQYCQNFSCVSYRVEVAITPSGIEYLEGSENGN